MKRVALVILGVVGAAMAFFVLIPEFSNSMVRRAGWRSSDPAVAALEDVQHAQQQSIRMLGSVRERLVALEAARGPDARRSSNTTLAFVGDTELSATVRSAFERRVREELAPLGDSLRYPVRVHIVYDSEIATSYRRVVVLPRDNTEACVLVVLISRPQGLDVLPLAQDRIVGTCGLYAAFGAPGRGMSSWLLETRGERAIADIEVSGQRVGERHHLSGLDVYNAPEVAACMAGNDSACVVAWAQSPQSWRRSPNDSAFAAVTAGTVRAYPYQARSAPGSNLGELRSAMTDARFGELWRSGKAPIDAYQEIEGRSIALHMREQLLDELQPHRPGPIRAELPFVLGGALALGIAALTIRLTKRQRS